MQGAAIMSLNDLVQRKLETLPPQPGVYVFYGKQRVVLYVGKARSLRSRVRSYFQPGTSDARAFVARLDQELIDLETFVTGSEKEAALLENQLIKAHQPRYNVKLKDDKDFLSLRINPAAPWPRIDVVRRPRKDGASYYGPYHSATAARQTLRLVNRHFQLRTCTDAELARRVRPCLQYQIKRCPAPCVLPVPREAYLEQVRDVGLFLSGRHDELVKHLERRMGEASRALDFEQAAVFRDQLRAVSRVQEEQRVTSVSGVDQDIVGLHRVADQAEVALLRIREGKLVNVRTFGLRDVSLPDDELLASFVSEFYSMDSAEYPDELLLPAAVEAMDGLAEVLSERRGSRVKVLLPQRGPRVRLLEMARENAQHAFTEKQRADQDVEQRLLAVQQKLRLPTLPRRIECIDISHSGGEDTVAAVVALLDGQPDRARYRSFHLQTVSGGDDYARHLRSALAPLQARAHGRRGLGAARPLGGGRRAWAAAHGARGAARSRHGRAAAGGPRQGEGERARRQAGGPHLSPRAEEPHRHPQHAGAADASACARRGAPLEQPHPRAEGHAAQAAERARQHPGGGRRHPHQAAAHARQRRRRAARERGRAAGGWREPPPGSVHQGARRSGGTRGPDLRAAEPTSPESDHAGAAEPTRVSEPGLLEDPQLP
jgi:excinuclease ABC subunit C